MSDRPSDEQEVYEMLAESYESQSSGSGVDPVDLREMMERWYAAGGWKRAVAVWVQQNARSRVESGDGGDSNGS